MVKSAKKTSASGEISAITGYFRQYEYSACVLYGLMQASYVSLGTELKGPLVRTMAKSWVELEQKFGVGTVRLRYIFAGYYSTFDTSLANANTTGARHSAEFARFVSREDLSPAIVLSSRRFTRQARRRS
jgi:hypothetical protein